MSIITESSGLIIINDLGIKHDNTWTFPPTTSSFMGSLLELLLSHSRTFLSKCPLMITFVHKTSTKGSLVFNSWQHLIRGDKVIAAGPSKLGWDASLAPQIPNLNPRISYFYFHSFHKICSTDKKPTSQPSDISIKRTSPQKFLFFHFHSIFSQFFTVFAPKPTR